MRWNLRTQEGADALADVLSGAIDKLNDVPVRLAALEQIVASREPRQSAGRVGGLAAAQAVERLQQDHAFQAAAMAAGRGQSLGSFAIKSQLDATSIKALIGGEPDSNFGHVVAPPERGGIQIPVARPLRLIDVIPQRPTNSDSVQHIRISKTGTAETQAVQGDEKSQLRLDGDTITAHIATVAAWTPASKQILADAAGLQDAIDRLLRDAIADELERLLIAGPGGVGQIEGLATVAALFSPVAPVVAENRADRLGEAVATMAAAGYRPNVLVLNPLDWLSVQRAKTNVEGAYLLGSPAVPLAPALWGCNVVTTSSLGTGDALVIDTAHVTVLDRMQPAVTISNSHSDYFVRNLVAILGELRAGLEIRDAGAIMRVSFDGLDEPVSDAP